MKSLGYWIFAGLLLVALDSCTKSNEATIVTTTVNISMGGNYAKDVYYKLSDGSITAVSRTNWDIAFIVASREASILTNTTAGVELKVYPSSSWNWADPVDTTGNDSWAQLYNSDTTWMEGAFNMNQTGHPNYGWGMYDMNTHNLTGVTLYILKTRAGSYKKIWIENKLSALQKYTFRYSDLDGSNEQTVTLDLAGSTKNFMYYSIDTNEEVDREPESSSWDLVFTRWIDKSIIYKVTGVLQNIDVTAQESTDTDPGSKAFPSDGFLTNMSTIGYDWKEFNGAIYEVDDTRVFFVKDRDGNIYRIRFKSFEGSNSGNLSFDVSILK